MFVSNCRNAGAETRLRLVEELMKHMEVHSYGRCLKNMDEPPRGKRSPNENKRFIISQYKWYECAYFRWFNTFVYSRDILYLLLVCRYLAFENNIIKDYVSEKVFDGFLAGTVPVYYGTSSVARLLPSAGAVIQFSDFSDVKSLAQNLTETGRDRARYESMLKWKKGPSKNDIDRFQSVIDMTAYKFTSLCRICQKLADGTPI